MDNFKLDIYTWPTLRGVECGYRTSYHETPVSAILYLESQVEPFAYAVLLKSEPGGHFPCDWEGRRINANEEWPRLVGTNGEHPAYVAVMADWKNLLAAVQREATKTGEGIVVVAHRLLNERHPRVTMLCERLAREAYEADVEEKL